MRPATALRIQAVMLEIASALNAYIAVAGPEMAGGPLGIAFVSVMNRLDELLAWLPAIPRARVDRHDFLTHIAEPLTGCPLQLRLDHTAAADPCELVLPLSDSVNETILWVHEDSDSEDFVLYRRLGGSVMGYLFAEILDPLWRQHPDLEPARMREGP